MADRLNVKITIESTDAADGSHFWGETQQWSDVPYGQLVEMQALLHELEGKLIAWGREDAQRKAAARK